MKERIFLVGCGGHAKVIIDIIEKASIYEIIGLIDNQKDLWGKDLLGYPILGNESVLSEIITKYPDIKGIIAIGNNKIRKIINDKLAARDIKLVKAVHPSAQIGKNVSIGDGTVIMANVAINIDTIIGLNCIINTGATIDHDNIIGDYVHVSPGAHLAGTVKISEYTHVCTGASIIPNITVGKSVIIGAGAVVIKDLSDNLTVAGVPAKVIKNID